MSEKITFADKKRKTVEQAEFTEDGRYLRKVRIIKIPRSISKLFLATITLLFWKSASEWGVH